MLTTLAGSIVASGQIEAAQNRQVVQHPDDGLVAEIDVAEGKVVQPEDILIGTNGTLLRSERSIVENQLFEPIARRSRLESERATPPRWRSPANLHDTSVTWPEILQLVEGQMKLFDARNACPETRLSGP